MVLGALKSMARRYCLMLRTLVVLSRRQSIRVAGDDYPAELVKAKFLKLDSHHIEFVMDCLREVQTVSSRMSTISSSCSRSIRGFWVWVSYSMFSKIRSR